MPTRFASILFAVVTIVGRGEAQEILIRRAVSPPPVTYQGLLKLKGTAPSGPCRFNPASLPADSLMPVALGDSATLRLPSGWRIRAPMQGDDAYTHLRLDVEDAGRVRIERERYGGRGRHSLMYKNGERPEGTTCAVDRGQPGAIWTFYLPDPADAGYRFPYIAMGALMTPAGRWYNLSLQTTTAAEQSRLAGMLTELMLLPQASAPSSSPSLDPVATVTAFWAAAIAMRWAEAVSLLDLTALEKSRQAELESARMPRGREYTAEDLMRRDPDMPREAAEYEIRRREKLRKQYPERPFRQYFGVDSSAQLARMSIEEVATRWIQGHDPLWQMLEQRRRYNCPPSSGLDSLFALRRPRVYGGVTVGDTAFVVFRSAWLPAAFFSWETDDIVPPQVAVLRKGRAGWRIRAVEDLVMESGLMGSTDCPSRKP